MIFLPGDVIREILLRVPAKSILNCQYVCKTWFSLISNPSFAKQHLVHNKRQSKLMFLTEDSTKPYYPLLSTVSYDEALYSSSFRDAEYVEIDPPFIDLANPIHLLGSCNGLICIMFQTRMVNGLVHLFVIWNPTTREYKILPHSQNDQKKLSIYSFGYDHKNDDYKLVKGDFLQDLVKLPPSEEDVHTTEIYSLESDSWRSIETIPYHMLKFIPFDSVSGVLVNGLRHWLSVHKYDNKEMMEDFIVSFDFSEERFRQMDLPKEFMDKSTSRHLFTVGVLQECLCLLDCVFSPYRFEIWVMQDYGVRESWTKSFVIPQAEGRQLYDLYPLRPIWSFKDDEILLLKTKDKREFVLYDPKQDTMVTNPIGARGAENYVESLVSLNSCCYVGSSQEYANILRASWTKRLHLFEYKGLVKSLGGILMVLWLYMGSTKFFRNHTMRKRFGQFVVVLCWLNSCEFKIWWWTVSQLPTQIKL